MKITTNKLGRTIKNAYLYINIKTNTNTKN